MLKELMFEGTWFVPEKKAEHYTGTLTYSQIGGCMLKLYNGIPRNSFENESINIIQGKGRDAQGKTHRVTLVNCFNISRVNNFGVIEIAVYQCQYAFIGFLYDSIDELVFTDLFSSLQDLDNWINIHGFEQKIESRSVSLEYNVPQLKEFEIKEDLKGLFGFLYSLEGSEYPSTFIVTQKISINLANRLQVSFHKLLKEFFTFFKFMGLAYGSAPPIISINLSNREIINPVTNTPYEVQLLYESRYVNRKYKSGRNDYYFLFSYEKIKNQFPEIIKKWFEIFEIVGPTIDILNEFLLNRQITTDTMMIRITQALESYHRELYTDHLSDEENADKQTLQNLIEQSPEYKEWLEEKFKYGFGRNLRGRLLDLMNDIPEHILEQLGLKSRNDKTKFAFKVVSSRNYYTHYGKESKVHKLSSGELIKAVHKLKVFLICLLLKRLGFNNDEILKMVQMHKVYPFAT